MWHFVNLLFYYLTCFKLFSFQKMTVFGILQSGSFILIMQSNCKICRFFRGYQSDRDFFQSIIFPKLWFFFQKKFYSETGTMYKTFSRVRGFLKDVAQFLTLWKTITSEIDMSKYSHFSTLQFLESENQKWTFSLGICHQNRMFKKTNKKQQSSTFWAKMNQNVNFSIHKLFQNLFRSKWFSNQTLTRCEKLASETDRLWSKIHFSENDTRKSFQFRYWHVQKLLVQIPTCCKVVNSKSDFKKKVCQSCSFQKCKQQANVVNITEGRGPKRDFFSIHFSF